MRPTAKLASLLLLVLQFFLTLQGIAETGPALHTARTYGEGSPVGNGMAWTWVDYDAKRIPTAIGFTFTETAMSGLPPEPPAPGEETWEHPLALPTLVKVPPYTHLVLNWNPHGHVPPGIYDVPHFDFHFYMIEPAVRVKITCKGADIAKCMKKPAAEFVSSGYILPPGTEKKRMGVHWIDPAAPEFNHQAFTHTHIYGSYDGHAAFLETMVTKSYLETKPNVTMPIKLPEKYRKHGYYPTTYSVKYDPARKEYSVSFEGLVRK